MENVKKITRFFFIIILVLFSATIKSQDAKSILKKAGEKCFTLNEGYYHLTERWKPMTGQDTIVRHFKTHYKIIPSDTIFGFAFNSSRIIDGELKGRYLYDGKNFITSHNDSSAVIMDIPRWTEDLMRIKHNYKFYSPLTDRKESIISLDTSTIHTAKLIGEEYLDDILCYHVQVNYDREDEEVDYLRTEYHYWIDKSDFLVHKYSQALDLVMNNDTMYQFHDYTIGHMDFRTIQPDSHFTVAVLPQYISLQEHKPFKNIPLLDLHTTAPDWTLPSLSGKEVKLSDLKGQLVLLDFFYKSCFPCMKALPVLQSLHEKYGSSGLKVIGIDPYDRPKEMEEFLQKRGVTYEIVFSDKLLPATYHVQGYPTMYLLDEAGKIIHAHTGIGEPTESTLEKVILEHLDK